MIVVLTEMEAVVNVAEGMITLTLKMATMTTEGSGPEWYISTIYHA